MWKKAFLLGALGFALGVAIGVILTSADPGDNLRAAFPYILVCGIPGCIAMGSSVIYDIEEWSLVRASVTHFLITFISYYAIALPLGWFRFGSSLFWIITAAMLAGYAVIWIIMHCSYKRQIRRMNDELRKMKSSRDPE